MGDLADLRQENERLERLERLHERRLARKKEAVVQAPVKDPDNIVWIDAETTDLIEQPHAVVLEIAAIITDKDLNELAHFGPVAIRASEEELAAMNPWALDMHTSTGLLERVAASALSRDDVDKQLAEFVAPYFPEKGEILADGRKYRGTVIGGNSVKFDFDVITRFFGAFKAKLDYRVIDVSSLGELVRRWNPAAHAAMPPKTSDHTAMTDIRECLKELRYYRSVGLG